MSWPSYDVKKLLSPDDLGVKIPCNHNQFLPCSSSSKIFKIRLIFENHERLIYHNKNGEQLLSLRYLHSKKYLYANPFCCSCLIDIVNFLRDSYFDKGMYFTIEELRPEIERLNNEAWDKLQQFKQQEDTDDVEMIYDYKTTFINLTRNKFCNADEFRAWTVAGNHVYRYRGSVIKGLVKVITEKEELDPLNFLKPWTFDNNADKYLFWNKLPNINYIDKTCAICLEELLRSDIQMYDCEAYTNRNIRNCLFAVEESLGSIVKLPCNLHMFHEPCILKWLYENPFCPMCHIRMPSHIDVPYRISPNLRLQDL